MEYLSITIAILSLILSSTQWIYTLYKNRTNFSMSLERFQWYEKPEYDYNQGIFTFMICNLSTAPLTITRMTIKKTSCLITHQWIGDHYYPKFPETDIPTTERQLSPDFPITIAPNGSGLYSIVFHFDLEAKRPGHHIKVTVQTCLLYTSTMHPKAVQTGAHISTRALFPDAVPPSLPLPHEPFSPFSPTAFEIHIADAGG